MPGINNRHRQMILDLKRDAGKAMLRAERPQHARAAIRRRSPANDRRADAFLCK
jgi:hypothetical protein